MKLLILGGRGMAGHMLLQYFSAQGDTEVWATARTFGESGSGNSMLQLDVRDQQKLERLLQELRPDAVVNAAGLLNEEASRRRCEAIYVNSLLPHLLASMAEKHGFRLIHISTDCVFSGTKGDYAESDAADGITDYAKSKSLGEVTHAPHTTIRTSIIGPELKGDGIGLFHWFMNQKGKVEGYSRVFWNGVTTLELSKAVDWCLQRQVSGLVHLAAQEKISKYELLLLMQSTFGRTGVTVLKGDGKASDKSLRSTRGDFGYTVPPYPRMLEELKEWMDRYGHGLYAY